MQIEKRLLTKRNILLVRGMGGAGKTTLLRHLAAWWHTTGFVERVFYFGYDEKAWTLQQIMTSIAQDLYGPKYYTDFQPLSLAAQQAMLSQDLRGKNHLLILDNLESITGAHLTIQDTLPPEDQAALHSFLIDLAKGNSFVLLGSRSGEDWLAKDTFNDNLYELPGLDPEAASTLADHILECNAATQYRQDEDLRKLIRVLDGFPIALEVVLANLAQLTPAEALGALQTGNVRIDPKSKSLDKAESILRCIDYSYINLSPEAQQLLICLAPFTSVVYTRTLDNYIYQLRKQPAMATLPFELWSEVLQEAENWGLLGPDPAMPRILRLQPVFPYFLLNRLNAPEQREVRSTVETAFRAHYDQVGEMLFELLQSKEPQKRQVGQLLTGLEYNNLITALNLALTAQVSILNLYNALSTYLDITQDQSQGLDLGQIVLSRLDSYQTIKLTDQVIDEFIGVIDNIAMRQFLLKQYVAAEEGYKKAIAILLTSKDFDSETIRKKSATIYHQLGMVAQGQRHWEQAEQYYQQALQIFIEHNVREYQGATYLQLGKAYYEQRKWDEAEQCYQQALKIRIEYNDRHELAKIHHLFGSMFLAQRKWDEAKQHYQQALQIYIVYNDLYAQADVHHNLGIIAREQRKWNKAEQYYQQALQVYIVYHDLNKQAGTYLQLGMLAEEQRQWEQAEQYYQQTLIRYNDRCEQAFTYHQLGRVAQGQQQWERAELYYQQALQIKGECNDYYGQAVTYGQLGLLEQDRKDWSQALDCHLRALGIFITYEDNHYISITIRNLAHLWKASGDTNLPAAVTTILGASVEDTEKLLRKVLGEE